MLVYQRVNDYMYMNTFHSYAKLPEDNALNHVWSSLTFMLYSIHYFTMISSYVSPLKTGEI